MSAVMVGAPAYVGVGVADWPGTFVRGLALLSAVVVDPRGLAATRTAPIGVPPERPAEVTGDEEVPGSRASPSRSFVAWVTFCGAARAG